MARWTVRLEQEERREMDSREGQHPRGPAKEAMARATIFSVAESRVDLMMALAYRIHGGPGYTG